MSSPDPDEVERIKNELSKAGIATETRRHAMAEAFGVPGLELWVQDERDFSTASSILGAIQATGPVISAGPAVKAQGEPLEADLPMNEMESERVRPAQTYVKGPDSRDLSKPKAGELEQASSLLAKEIEEILKHESKGATERITLRTRVDELSQALAQAQATLAGEIESRAAAERKHAEIMTNFQSALERARTGHSQMEALLKSERHEFQQQLKLRDDSLEESFKKLEAKCQLVQIHQTALAKLKQDMVSLQHQRDEHEKSLAKALADALLEREARTAAEARAEGAVAAYKSLEKQLADQVASLNSLYSRLHAKRAAKG